MDNEIDNLEDLRKLDLPFDVDEVSSQCHQCVRDQLEKYKKQVDESGKSVANRFIVPCHGIKKTIIDPVKEATLTDKQIETLKAVNDVVSFAGHYLKLPDSSLWNARWYQEQVLKCTSKRKVLRIGRRCLVPGSMVLMANGKWKPIEDIRVGEYVASRNAKNQLVSKKVLYEHDNGIKDVFNIKISNGMEITCTSNHPLLALETLEFGKGVRKVWKSLEDGLSVGTKIVVAKHYDRWGEKHNPSLMKLFGYMLTDGYFGKPGQTPKFTNNNRQMVSEVQCLAKELFDYDCSIRPKGNGFDIYLTDGDHSSINKFSETLKTFGLHGVKSARKHISDLFFDYDKQSQMALVNRMFSGDGGVSLHNKREEPRAEVFLVSSSKEIIRQVQLILRKINVESFISHDNRQIDVMSCGVITESDSWKLRISRAESIENFFANVGLVYGKEDVSNKAISIANSIKKRRRSGSKQFRHETIKSIEHIGESQTYDIEVEDTHNFIVDNIVSHNTGKTDLVCVEICYYLFTRRNIKLVVVGPQKSHTEEIINRVRAFISNNPMMKDSVVRDVSAPYYEIKLRNGSRLRGFAAGTKGKQQGVSVRGQDADRIYIEEMDYVDENAIQGAIFPIMMTNPDTALIGFSTPSGFRSPYYNLCEESPQYKEFHFTYKVLPWWRNVELERNSFTEEQWTHEYLAEWGTSESGVYKPEYIDRAITEYNYDDMVRNSVWKYTIGTDWNEKFGTEIVVLGYNTLTTMFQVVESVHIERSEFTQLAGVSKLIEMNRKWRPSFIYIDAGNGSTNYELLRKKAYDNSRFDGDRDTARLLSILKKYDAGAALEVRDPVSQQKHKTPAKPFMVNSSVRMFEQGKIRISSRDKVLEKQLRSYIIERYTPTKTPVYGLDDPKLGDHKLDALNLSIVAFQLEFNDLHATKVITDIGVSVDPRTISKKSSNPREESFQHKRPEPRDLNGGIRTPLEERVFAHTPGRIDNGLEGIRTNRPGWSTDEEDKHIQKFLQKRRSRFRLRSGRPRRTNI